MLREGTTLDLAGSSLVFMDNIVSSRGNEFNEFSSSLTHLSSGTTEEAEEEVEEDADGAADDDDDDDDGNEEEVEIHLTNAR